MGTRYLFPSKLANQIPPVEVVPNRALPKKLRQMHALDVLSLQPFVAGDHVEGDFVAFIKSFKSRTDNGRVMHEDVLPGTLGDKPKPFFVVEPLHFATSHSQLLIF
jgi:hypothetical protein